MSVLSGKQGGGSLGQARVQTRSNRRNGQTNQAFEEAIHALSSNLKEADEVATEIMDLFFRIATERETLPDNCSKDTIDAFLTSLVALIGFNTGQPLAVQALEILFKYIKNGKCGQ